MNEKGKAAAMMLAGLLAVVGAVFLSEIWSAILATTGAILFVGGAIKIFVLWIHSFRISALFESNQKNAKQIEQRWWHRLAFILGWSVVGLTLIVGAGFAYADTGSRYYVYSFEDGYESRKAVENSCFAYTYLGSIYCGEFGDVDKFLDFYAFKMQNNYPSRSPNSTTTVGQNIDRIRASGSIEDIKLATLLFAERDDWNGITYKQPLAILPFLGNLVRFAFPPALLAYIIIQLIKLAMNYILYGTVRVKYANKQSDVEN